MVSQIISKPGNMKPKGSQVLVPLLLSALGRVYNLSSVASKLLEDLHMSSGNCKFKQCRLVVAVLAENDYVPFCDSSC